MIKRIRRHARAAQTGRNLGSGASYSVGYGKPPKQHQFQPGQCGNRKGRPKGVKNTLTLLRDILDRKIEVRIGGTLRKMSVREAILTRFAEAALKGDTKSAAFLLQRYDMMKQPRSTRITLRRRTNKKSSTPICRTFSRMQVKRNDQLRASVSRCDFADGLQFLPPTLLHDPQPGIAIPAELAHTRDRVPAGTDSAR